MYADRITGSMQRAMDEVSRRRVIQLKYNNEHGITPKTIVKSIREDRLAGKKEDQQISAARELSVSPEEVPHILEELTSKMHLAAANLDFEEAAKLRDKINSLKGLKKRRAENSEERKILRASVTLLGFCSTQDIFK